MRRLVVPLCLALLAPIAAMAQALAPPAPVLCITSPPTNCSSLTHVGSGSQGEQAYHFLGKLNDWGLQLGLFSNQPANYIEATPNGSSGLPSLRQLVSADFPVPLSLIGVYTGVIQSWSSTGGTINGTLDLSFDVNGNAFLLGNAGLYLGASVSGSLNLETSNVDRMFINSTGNLWINAPSSGVALAVTAQGTNFAETYGATGNATNGAGGIGFDSSGSMYLESTVGALNVGTTTATGFNILTNGSARFNVSSNGAATVNAPASGVALTVNGISSQFTALFQASTTTGASAGPRINAGTNSSDDSFQVANAAGTTNYFNVLGDGGIVVGAATGGDKGVGTVNMAGCYVNGVTCGGGSGTVNSGTTNQIAYYSANGTAVSGSTTLPTSAMPAISGDVTISAGTTTATVSKVNGASFPVSALVGGWNSSGQAVATSIAANTALCNATGSAASPTACSAATLIAILNSGTPNAQTGTSYTFALTDAFIPVTMSNSSANTICVPPNSSVAFPLGTILTTQAIGSGVTTLAPAGASGCSGSGVTINSGAYGSSTSQTYTLGGKYGFLQIQQTATNTWNVIAWDTPAGQQIRSLAINAEMQAYLAASTTFTETPTGCTPSATSGGPFAGKITLASGPCTSIIVTMNGATGFTDSNGYDCSVEDETLQNAGTWFGRWGQTADNSTTATIPIPSAAGATDVISFSCHPRSL